MRRRWQRDGAASERNCGCGWKRIEEEVVIAAGADGRASYRGLMTCNLAWECPVCASRKRGEYAELLVRVIDAWRRRGGGVYLATFTVRHALGDDLRTLAKGISDSFRDAMGWSDALPSPDGSRLFVNDTDANQVHVFNSGMQMLMHSLDVGTAPVHLFNPNHGNEIWTHSDGQGAFYVIDTQSLAVQGPVTAALGGTGHGKLLYDPMVAPKAYATNVTSAAAFPVNLEHKTVGYQIKLCESDALLPCTDNADCTDAADTCDIGGSDTCGTTTHKVGGTHDKAISPYNGYAYFQCIGGSPGYSIVEMATDSVAADMVAGLSGSAAQSADHRYIFLMDGEDVHVLDTMNDNDVTDAMTPDVTFTIGGTPSARGTHSWVPGGNYNDMRVVVPQTGGTKVWILNMAMIGMINAMPEHARTEVEVGTLTAPVGASHFERRGVVADHYYFTMSDAGIVPVDLEDGTAGDPIAIAGMPSRFAFVDNAGAVDTSGGSAPAGHMH